jgi:hypothetical protein
MIRDGSPVYSKAFGTAIMQKMGSAAHSSSAALNEERRPTGAPFLSMLRVFVYSVPLFSCSRSIASNSALKLPIREGV